MTFAFVSILKPQCKVECYYCKAAKVPSTSHRGKELGICRHIIPLTMRHHLENGMESGNGNLGKWNLSISSLFLRVERMGSTEVHPYPELLGSESHGWVSANTTWRQRNVEGTRGMAFHARSKWWERMHRVGQLQPWTAELSVEERVRITHDHTFRLQRH